MKKYFTLKNILWCLLFLVIVAPFTVTIFCSVPCADDFSMSSQYKDSASDNPIVDSANMAIYQYFNWGGGFPFNFLQYLWNPITWHSASSYYYGLFLCISFLVFILLFFLFLNIIFKYIFLVSNESCRNIANFSLIFVFLNTALYSEIFYWFVGNSYLWEVDSVLITLSLTIYYFRKNAQKNKVVFLFLCLSSAVSSFFYQASVIVLLIFIYELFHMKKNNKKFNVSYFVPLFIILFFTCISCFAPGNFIRQVAENSGVASPPNGSTLASGSEISLASLLIKALMYSLQNTYNVYFSLISLPIIVFYFLLCFVAGCVYGRRSNSICNGKYLLILILFQIISVFSIVFPVAFGYGKIDFPNRMYFIVNLVVLVYCALTFFVFGSWLSVAFPSLNFSNVPFVFASFIVISFSFVLVLPSVKGNTNFDQLPYVYTSKNMYSVCQQSRESKAFLNFLANTECKNVIVTDSKYSHCVDTCGIARVPIVYDDPSHWVNTAMSTYFGKDSVVLKI